MLRFFVTLVFCLLLTDARAGLPGNTEAELQAYFALWASNETVTPKIVAQHYARRVDYYGQVLTQDGVYRNKKYLIGLWPYRKYSVQPGSVSKNCDLEQNTCQITVILNWQSINPSRLEGTQGATTVTLGLIREDGVLKIERESGVPLVRSVCKLLNPNWVDSSNWRCSAFGFPSLPATTGNRPLAQDAAHTGGPVAPNSSRKRCASVLAAADQSDDPLVRLCRAALRLPLAGPRTGPS